MTDYGPDGHGPRQTPADRATIEKFFGERDNRPMIELKATASDAEIEQYRKASANLAKKARKLGPK